MRLGWRIGLPGPFSIGGTLWRSKPKRRYKVLSCGHAHRTEQAYLNCKDRKTR